MSFLKAIGSSVLFLGTAVGLSGPSAASGGSVWAVGNSGTVLKSADDGDNWSLEPHVTDYTLYDVQFVGGSAGCIVGDHVVLTTSNGGATWTETHVGYVLNAVYLVDAVAGWAVGTAGTILRTTDGFATWTVQTSGTNFTLRDVFFVTPSLGWAVGDGVILETTDGGDTWASTYPGYVLRDAWFLDADRGWAVGNTGTILSTTDGGLSWIPDPALTGYNLTGIHFVGNLGVISGDHEILRSSNGGATWSDVYDGGYALNDVYFRNAVTGWAVGSTGSVLKTADGGVSWSARSSGTNAPLHAVTCVPSASSYPLSVTAGAGGSAQPSSGSFPAGSTVEIRAEPDSGYVFDGWTGSGNGSYTGLGNPVSVTMLGSISQTAHFRADGSGGSGSNTVYVDAAAPPGGNGSQFHPVRTVSQGMAMVPDGGRVVVAAGSYDETISTSACCSGKTYEVIASGGAVIIGR